MTLGESAGRSTWRLAGSLVATALVIAVMALPRVALAATPTFGPGFQPPEPEPDPGALGGLWQTLSTAAGIGVPLAVAGIVIFGLGRVVGSLGGPPGAKQEPAAAVAPAAGSRGSRLWFLAVRGLAVGTPVVLGVLVGREMAFQASSPGLASLGAVVLLILVLGAVIGLVLVGALALRARRGASSAPIRYVFLAAGLLPAAMVVGLAMASATGGVYHVPVVLEAPGTSSAAWVQAPGMEFVANDGGETDCRSRPDGRDVATVVGLELGELRGGTLRAWIELDLAGGGTHAQLLIDGADLPAGADQPVWSGPGTLAAVAVDGATGSVRFDDLPLEEGSSGGPLAWPSSLSGGFSWSCSDWEPLD